MSIGDGPARDIALAFQQIGVEIPSLYDKDAIWESHRCRVVCYVTNNGRFPRKRGGDAEETFLGLWCGTQRATKKAGDLSHERIILLESMQGWKWEPDFSVWYKICESVRCFVENNKKIPSAKSTDEHEAKLGEWLQTQKRAKKEGRHNLSLERISMLEGIPYFSWTPQLDTFQVKYDALKAIAEENLFIRSNLRKKNKQLASWCGDQKKSYHCGEMLPERIKLLEALSGWTWDVDANTWNFNYRMVKEFISTNGMLPPNGTKDKKVNRLAGWCGYQREYKDTRLSPEKKRLLEALQGWYWDKDIWRERYDEVLNFVTTHGRTPEYAEEGGRWCAAQRYVMNDMERSRQKNIKPNRNLSDEKIKLLEAIPEWNWKPQHTRRDKERDCWQGMYESVNDFVHQNNKIPHGKRGNSKESILGRWCVYQRIRKKSGELLPDKIKLLEAISGWVWDVFAERWYKNYHDLQICIHKGRVPSCNTSLGRWCDYQRSARKDGKLSDEQIRLLESVQGWEWDREWDRHLCNEWMNNYQAIKSHTAANNRLHRISENKHLYNWCGDQRKYKKRNQLSTERIALLESIPVWKWDEGFNIQERVIEIKSFMTDNGRFPRTKGGDKYETLLGRWSAFQRCNRTVLSEDEQRMMESISGWRWNK